MRRLHERTPAFGAVTVKLDLVAGDAGATEDGGTHALVQDLSLGRLRGVGLAFEHAMRMTLTGVMPDGSEHSVQARVVDVPAFLCLKAFALSERVKPKDAYDVFFCLRHYRNGPGALGAAAAELARGAKRHRDSPGEVRDASECRAALGRRSGGGSR
jgi:hypothetical protein